MKTNCLTPLTNYLDEKISWLYEHPKDQVSLQTHIEELEKIRDALKDASKDLIGNIDPRSIYFASVLSEQG